MLRTGMLGVIASHAENSKAVVAPICAQGKFCSAVALELKVDCFEVSCFSLGLLKTKVGILIGKV